MAILTDSIQEEVKHHGHPHRFHTRRSEASWPSLQVKDKKYEQPNDHLDKNWIRNKSSTKATLTDLVKISVAPQPFIQVLDKK
jgi:hypothetical protein